MKVIFLDIDGVLNCKTSKSKCGKFTGIDSDKVKRLENIVKATDAVIVLSSTWKLGFNKDHEELQDAAKYLRSKLNKYKIRILSSTPDIKWNHRGEEINKWLEINDDVYIESFLVLDDEEFDYDKYPDIKNNLLLTQYETGLTDEDVDKAIMILNGGENG